MSTNAPALLTFSVVNQYTGRRIEVVQAKTRLAALRAARKAHGYHALVVQVDAAELATPAPAPARKSTARTLTRALRAAGYAEVVVQGRGYVYLAEGDASSWYSSSIPVCYTRELDDESIVRHRNELASRGFGGVERAVVPPATEKVDVRVERPTAGTARVIVRPAKTRAEELANELARSIVQDAPAPDACVECDAPLSAADRERGVLCATCNATDASSDAAQATAAQYRTFTLDHVRRLVAADPDAAALVVAAVLSAADRVLLLNALRRGADAWDADAPLAKGFGKGSRAIELRSAARRARELASNLQETPSTADAAARARIGGALLGAFRG